mgnify:CR=1 FL=1|jgi:long-chain acyl-CoA synthetase
MLIDYLISVFEKNKDKTSIIWKDQEFSYNWLISKYHEWDKYLKHKKVKSNSVVLVRADFSPNSIALLLALIRKKSIIIPLTSSINSKINEFISISQPEIQIEIRSDDQVSIYFTKNNYENELYKRLKNNNKPGLVLFSSGSTGTSKASVHDLSYLLERFHKPRKTLITITFLLFDHIGGINTLFYVLSNAGTIVTTENRKPETILKLIEKYKIELLPTSPTFLNLLLMSEEYKNFNMKSLKIISYGTEPMPQTTLNKLNSFFPKITFKQTYGLSEVGILQSRSKSSDSLWVKIGGENNEIRIVNGLLEIKSKSAMLGYLNAPTPFTHDGWFKTGDQVEEKGDSLKIIGRKSEIINVGGEKVYPQEVENILLKIDTVFDATVYGEKNLIIGNIVCAKIQLKNYLKPSTALKKEIKKFCSQYLERYKVPVKIEFKKKLHLNLRFKKSR